MSKHTPGPLIASNRNALGSWCIYRANPDNQSRPSPHHVQAIGEANAHADAVLWAAAPEILAALVSCRDWILSQQTSAKEGESIRLEARAAIEKAMMERLFSAPMHAGRRGVTQIPERRQP